MISVHNETKRNGYDYRMMLEWKTVSYPWYKIIYFCTVYRKCNIISVIYHFVIIFVSDWISYEKLHYFLTIFTLSRSFLSDHRHYEPPIILDGMTKCTYIMQLRIKYKAESTMTYAMVYNGEIRRLSNFRLDTLLYYYFSIFFGKFIHCWCWGVDVDAALISQYNNCHHLPSESVVRLPSA